MQNRVDPPTFTCPTALAAPPILSTPWYSQPRPLMHTLPTRPLPCCAHSPAHPPAFPLATNLAVIRAYRLWGKALEVLHEPYGNKLFGCFGHGASWPLIIVIDWWKFLACLSYPKRYYWVKSERKSPSLRFWLLWPIVVRHFMKMSLLYRFKFILLISVAV